MAHAAAALSFNFQSLTADIARTATSILQRGPAIYSAKDIHSAAKLLNSLNVSGYQSHCSAHCDGLTNAFKQSSSSLQMYYAHSAATACGCSGAKFTAKSFIAIDEDLEVLILSLFTIYSNIPLLF
jgi:hypothetical protein